MDDVAQKGLPAPKLDLDNRSYPAQDSCASPRSTFGLHQWNTLFTLRGCNT